MAGLLRFGLAEMAERNAHHEFEHLCREVAAARIASNILPATGPVARGGDQGRDFETFVSYLASEPFPVSAFAARASDETIVFTCTLQESDLPGKIIRDLRKIAEQGSPVDRVYSFFAQPMAVSQRHAVAKRAMTEIGLQLEIVDQHALADFLSDSDLVWVVGEYLHLPVDIGELVTKPPEDERPAWYVEKRDEWRQRYRDGNEAATIAELLDIRAGLDFALFNDKGREDIDAWAQMLAPLKSSPNARTRQLALYSTAVSRYRGASAADGDSATREFFARLRDLNDPAIMDEASTLLSYLAPANGLGLSVIPLEEQTAWRDQLLDHLETLITQSPGPNVRASLIACAAELCVKPDISVLQPETETESPAEEIVAPPARLLRDDDVDSEALEGLTLYRPERGMALYEQLVQLLPDAPLFPVRSALDQFDFMSPLLVQFDSFASIRDGLDDAFAAQAGEQAIAARARDRGMRLLQADRNLEALREMHTAKRKWWSGDTKEGTLLACLVISRIYYRLRLAWASKMYALAAGLMAVNSTDGRLSYLFPRGLFLASIADGVGGHWYSMLDTLEDALHAHAEYSSDPWNAALHEEMADACSLCATAYRFSNSTELQPLRQYIESLAAVSVFVRGLDDERAVEHERVESTAEQFVVDTVNEFSSAIVSDAGATCTAYWSALGFAWQVSWSNDQESSCLGERFVVIAQIVQAEMAHFDFLPLLTSIRISVGHTDGGESTCELEDTSGHATGDWKITLSKYVPSDNAIRTGNSEELTAEIIACLFTILIRSSARKYSDVEAALRVSLMETDLITKTIAGRPIDELIEKPQEFFEARSSMPEMLVVGPGTRGNSQLAGFSGAGPGYDKARSMEAIAQRYSNVRRNLPTTLARVLADREVKADFRRLRDEGWLDWQLLSVVSNVVLNYRSRADVHRPEMREEIERRSRRPESPDDEEVPLERFSYEQMKMHAEVMSVVIFRGWGLEVKLSHPPKGAVTRVLEERYRYLDDDVDHEEIDLSDPDSSDKSE